MRHILIGDIHGCLEEFNRLIAAVAPVFGDRVICLGDFMDKGPEPAACVRYARELGYESVLGNHEERHLKWRRNIARERSDPNYTNKMRHMKAADLEQNKLLSDEDVEWLRGLPVYLEFVPGYVAVHGGLFRGLPLDKQPADKIVRARWVDAIGDHVPVDYDSRDPQPPNSFHWTELYDGPWNVIYGHEAHSLTVPRVDALSHGVSCFGIDTGAVHGGRLTAMIFDEHMVPSFVQVQARTRYAEPNWEIPIR